MFYKINVYIFILFFGTLCISYCLTMHVFTAKMAASSNFFNMLIFFGVFFFLFFSFLFFFIIHCNSGDIAVVSRSKISFRA